MAHKLYFIPILLDALGAPDPLRSLREAFQTIEALGQDPEYRDDYAQFRDFMVAVHNEMRMLPSVEDEANIESLVLLEAVLFGSRHVRELHRKLVHRPDLRIRLEAFRRAHSEYTAPQTCVELVLYRRETEILRARLASPGDTVSAPGLAPDAYRVAFSTGRLIWEGRLEEADLLVTQGPQSRPLRLAAAAEGDTGQPTREIACYDGAILLRTYAGLENGALEIALRRLEPTV